MAEGLADFLSDLPRAGLLVLAGADQSGTVPPEVPTRGLDHVPDARERSAVVVAVADRLALREWAESLGDADLGTARTVAVHLDDAPWVAPRLVPSLRAARALHSLRSRRLPDGGWLIVWRFDKPVAAAAVLVETARQSVWRDRTGNAGLWSGPAASEPDAAFPVEVVVSAGDPGPDAHPLLGRPPVVVRPPELRPLDERVLNPSGFLTTAAEPVVPLASPVLSESLVRSLRPHLGASVTWPESPSPALARTVAGLSMAGTPLVAPAVPGWAADLLGAPVAAALSAPVDLADAVAREEHSLVLRRAALDAHSLGAWRRSAGASAGVRVAGPPSVSIVLATRRPDMLGFALRQVRRQRGVPVQLVLAPHGFDADEVAVRRALGPDVDLVLAPQPASVSFGDLLHGAFLRSSGDVVLKMDDDDWYAPDVVADLLRARSYSGAEVVGMPAQLHYLTEQRLTVRRGHPTEVYARFVAGGTLMIDRSLLASVGGFRSVRKWVDAQLLAAVSAAGGSIYRTHGLGYVLRRNPTGHTWQVDLDYLLDPDRVASTSDGFVPSRLLEADPADLP